MSSWNQEELNDIIKEDDLHISPFRNDGETYGTPTWIWCVEVKDELYVRAYHGQNSSWYQAAMEQGAGRIHAAGEKWDVTFKPVKEEKLLNCIDQAYKGKYNESPYLKPMISDRARSATVRINLT